MYGAFLFLARINSWTSTVVQNLTIGSERGWSRHKEYGDFLGKLLQQATELGIGTVTQFVGYWKPQELCIPKSKLPVDL